MMMLSLFLQAAPSEGVLSLWRVSIVLAELAEFLPERNQSGELLDFDS